MATWVAIDVGLADNPKLWAFAAAIYPAKGAAAKMAIPAAAGHLTFLLGAVKTHAPDGDVSDVPDALLESWARWGGEASKFASAFRQIFTRAGLITGWEEWNGRLTRQQQAERERWHRRQDARSRERSEGGVSAEAPLPAPAEPPPPTYLPTYQTTTTATPRARGAPADTGQRADLKALLPPMAHPDLERAVAETDRPAALAAELRAALDGMHGPPVAPDVVGQAVHDLVANGDHKRFNARLVRRYLAGVDPPAKPNGNGHASASPLATDAERAFQDALALIRDTPGGWRQITADTLASLPPPVRAGIRAADGVRALADADEFTLRAKRKLFTAAYLSCPQTQPA